MGREDTMEGVQLRESYLSAIELLCDPGYA